MCVGDKIYKKGEKPIIYYYENGGKFRR